MLPKCRGNSFSHTLTLIYETTRRHIPKDLQLNRKNPDGNIVAVICIRIDSGQLNSKRKWPTDRQPQRDSDLNISFFYPEGVSNKVFRSVGKFQSDYIVSYLRRRPLAIFINGTTE